MAAGRAKKNNKRPSNNNRSIRKSQRADSTVRLDHAVNMRVLRTLIETEAIDAGLVYKLLLLTHVDDTRAILDALTMTDPSRIGSVRDQVCSLLSTVRASGHRNEMRDDIEML